ncbi:hypothetical protein [Bradyrhizobium sp. P5_C11_2]
MGGTDDYLRLLRSQAAAEEAFLDRVGHAEDTELTGRGTAPATSPAVSLMITNRQRAALRELGFSEEAIRQMTPAEAHEKLGLAKPFQLGPN